MRATVPIVGRNFVNAPRITCWFLIVGAGLSVLATSSICLARGDASKRFVPLYNRKNLDGWSVYRGERDVWQSNGPLLSCVQPGGGWLRTTAEYSDFILRLEFKIPPGGNSGVGLRIPEKGDPTHAGMEIQILDDDAEKHRDLKPAQYCGGIYHQVAATKRAANPPGEWNSYEITCIGHHVQVVLNGTVVNDVMIDAYTTGEGDQLALADRPQIGRIGLQSHGSRVDFRNIEINDVITRTESGLTYVDTVMGNGEVVPEQANVKVHYTGRFVSGEKFDSSRDRGKPNTFPLSDVIAGWSEGLPGMKVGGRRKLIIPPNLAYGKEGAAGTIPPDAVLIFDVEVLALP